MATFTAEPMRTTRERLHWAEYLIEAAGLGLFMLMACTVGVLLEHTGSGGRQAIPEDMPRRLVFGIAMGLTAMGIIYSPWGQRSGAHLNPATTLTFFRLGKVGARDALAYVIAQLLGGMLGVALALLLLGAPLADPSVHFLTTRPGAAGPLVAFVAELLISFGLMTVVLHVSNTRRIARFTGLSAGLLVATYITIEAPLSGMSMNPARTLGSAVVAQDWTAIWVYFTAPFAGMLAAAELYLRAHGRQAVLCAKLHHPSGGVCHFRCRF